MQKQTQNSTTTRSIQTPALFRSAPATCNCRHTAKTGVTLVEIMVAAGVLALLLLIGFKVFTGFSNSFQKGSWALSTQNKLRNALTFVREEMQKATAMTVVSLSGTTITEANYEFLLNSNDTLTGNATIAKWAICLPYVASDPDSPGATFRCELSLAGGELIYKKNARRRLRPEKQRKAIFRLQNHRQCFRNQTGTRTIRPRQQHCRQPCFAERQSRTPRQQRPPRRACNRSDRRQDRSGR